MATVDLTNWAEKNPASVTDPGTTPLSINKVQPIKVTWNNSTPGSGTGDAEFGNDSKFETNEDIVVTESDEPTTRPFEIESVDNTNNEAWIWVYGSWDRDGTDQIVIGLGDDGDGTDYSQAGTGSNAYPSDAGMVHHMEETVADETSGTTISDSTSNGNDGTVEGAEVGVSGQIGTAAEFDGVDDYINYGNDSSIAVGEGQSITLTAWVRIDNFSGDRHFFDKWSGGPNNFLFRYDNGNNYLDFFISDDSSNSVVDTGAGNIPNTGEWTLVTAVFDNDNNTQKIFINGTEEGSKSTAYDPAYSNHIVTNGAGFNGSSSFNQIPGEMDASRIYVADSSVAAKDSDWIQAEYDASPKGGQDFFSWGGAESTTGSTDNPGHIRQTKTGAIVETKTGAIQKTN